MKKFINRKGVVFSFVALSALLLNPIMFERAALAATDSVNALASVISSIALQGVSDLQFGEGIQGDSAKIVDPGNAENGENASFRVTGEPNRSYNIVLPSDGTVEMIVGAGDTDDKKIAVDQFSSFPSGTGTLDDQGEQLIFVGATRAALRASQEAGEYSGSFDVTVNY